MWSGDIHSSFESFRNQFAAGLNMGIAGIPWWTTDIGGFHGGDPHRPRLPGAAGPVVPVTGAFCPVMRLHGDRYPHPAPAGHHRRGHLPFRRAQRGVVLWGGGLRNLQEVHVPAERLRPYIKEQMAAAHEKGTPVMRPLFYDFPGDSAACGPARTPTSLAPACWWPR